MPEPTTQPHGAYPFTYETFGTGSVQNVIEIPDGSALILSVAKYYTPNGKSIQDNAITPNILVADAQEEFAVPDDEDAVHAAAPFLSTGRTKWNTVPAPTSVSTSNPK